MQIDKLALKRIFFVIGFAKKYRAHLTLLTLASVLEMCVALFAPMIAGLIIDDALIGKDLLLFHCFAIAALLFYLARAFGDLAFLMLSNNYLVMFSRDFQFYVLKRVFDLPYKEINESSTATIVTRILEDSSVIAKLTSLLIPNIICVIINTSFLLTICMFFNAPITFGVLLVVPMHLALSHFWGLKQSKVGLACRNTSQSLYSLLTAYVKSIKMIKGNRLEYIAKRKYHFDWIKYMRLSFKSALINFSSNNSKIIVMGLFYFAVYYFLISRVIAGWYSVGFFIAFIAYIKMLSDNLAQYGALYHSILSTLPSFKRLFELLPDVNIENERQHSAVRHEDACSDNAWAVNIEGLAYSSNKQLYHNLDFRVSAGDVIAITGQNGCGKTTLLNIICGIISPDGGGIEIFGKDIRQYTSYQLRKQIGVVYCNSNDVDFINKPYTQDDESSLFDINEVLPSEYAPSLARSTGEQYMASFLMILARNPKILLLDEPLANLDTNHKKQLLELINTHKRSMTFVITAHQWHEFNSCADSVYQILDEKLKRLQ